MHINLQNISLIITREGKGRVDYLKNLAKIVEKKGRSKQHA
jgi:hypothetical protein